jgi:GNAT superfamily N-acetyltransferase
VTIRRVTDEADLRRWHQVRATTEAFDFVSLPVGPIDELRPILDGPVNGEATELLLAVDGDVPVAAVRLRMPINDNLTLANAALHVHPDHRRRGHGRRVLEAGIATARERGRTRMLIEVPAKTRHLDPSPGVAFVESFGAKPLHVETRRLLNLASLSPADLTALGDEASLASVGYSVVVWRDHTPAQYVEDMASLLALMSTDPPQGELDLEPEVWDADRYLVREAAIIARRQSHLTAAARDDRTAHLVGFTDLGVPAGGGDVGYQWETVVAGKHRGHRLGMLVKVANVLQLTEFMPEVRYLNTWNADENTHMVAVNERLGFQPMEAWTEWGLDL